MKTLIIAGIAVALIGGTAASAQEAQVEGVNVREAKIDGRIDQGVKSGSLTGPEAEKLKDEYRALVQLEADYRKSGGIDDKEKAELSMKLTALNARVVGQKHDAQVNPNR